MIFATVGTQLPFDRLIRALDLWAKDHPHEEVFAQIGHTDYEPKFMGWERRITPEAFLSHMIESRITVAHAGMGTVISAIEYGKPVVVMPRRAEFNEHRNDHQLATVSRLSHLSGLHVVHSQEDLTLALSHRDVASTEMFGQSSSQVAVSTDLISEIRDFAGLRAA